MWDVARQSCGCCSASEINTREPGDHQPPLPFEFYRSNFGQINSDLLTAGRMHVRWLAACLHIDHQGSATYTAGHIWSYGKDNCWLPHFWLCQHNEWQHTGFKLILPTLQMSHFSIYPPTFEIPTRSIGCRWEVWILFLETLVSIGRTFHPAFHVFRDHDP
jgi:hypothetical protein